MCSQLLYPGSKINRVIFSFCSSIFSNVYASKDYYITYMLLKYFIKKITPKQIPK